MTPMPVYVEPVGLTSLQGDRLGEMLEEVIEANPGTKFPLCCGRYDLLSVIEKDEEGAPCFVLMPLEPDEEGRRDIVLAPCRSHKVSPTTTTTPKITSEVIPLEAYTDSLTAKVISSLLENGLTPEEVAKRTGFSMASIYRKKKKGAAPIELTGEINTPPDVSDLRQFIRSCEKDYIREAVTKLGGRELAAACLGISIATLYRKLGR